jgi:DNA-directed RNA polymerase specialized sigma24 family protein
VESPSPAAAATTKAEALFTQWRRFAYLLVHRWYPTYRGRISFEDFKSAALVGLWKAAEYFDESRGLAFVTYAGACIKNEFLSLVGSLKKEERRHHVFIDHPPKSEQNEEPFPNVLDRGAAAWEEETDKPHDNRSGILFGILNYIRTATPGLLTAAELHVLRGLYLDGKSLTETMQDRKSACVIHRKALRKLRKHFDLPALKNEGRLGNPYSKAGHNRWHRNGRTNPACPHCAVQLTPKQLPGSTTNPA